MSALARLLSNSNTFKAFSSDIWMIMISMIVLIPALITLIKIHQSKKMISHIIAENYLNVWGIFCQQGLSGKNKKYLYRLKITFLSC